MGRVYITCSVKSGQEVWHLTWGSRVDFRGWVFWLLVRCDISGIVASSVRGAGETCVICHCS